MNFEGCAPEHGATVVLRGADEPTLKTLKGAHFIFYLYYLYYYIILF